jgi:hypothetical protein
MRSIYLGLAEESDVSAHQRICNPQRREGHIYRLKHGTRDRDKAGKETKVPDG